jgi:hypothetical protein
MGDGTMCHYCRRYQCICEPEPPPTNWKREAKALEALVRRYFDARYALDTHRCMNHCSGITGNDCPVGDRLSAEYKAARDKLRKRIGWTHPPRDMEIY